MTLQNQIIRNGAPGSFVETTKEEYWKCRNSGQILAPYKMYNLMLYYGDRE